MSGFESSYSLTDKALHNLAFSSLGLQRTLSGLEDRFHAKRLNNIPIEAPVFVTALPRAGTTLLLEVLAATPGFAAHSYRDMPFLLCPLLWNSMSAAYRVQAKAQERAHGDGMTVGYDSPEAFEEVIWRLFWPRHYSDARILPWGAQNQNPRFADFYRQHMRKILLLRSERPEQARYLSKNNVNFARIPLLARMFPDCRIVVPFRRPLDHVGSLLRQQQNFTEVHAQDRFAKRYMESIGHLEFGQLARPINVDNWLARETKINLDTPAFWLRYWMASAKYLLKLACPNLILLDYDHCCAQPAETLQALSRSLNCDPAGLLAQATRFRPAKHYAAETLGVTPPDLRPAKALHQNLQAAALAL